MVKACIQYICDLNKVLKGANFLAVFLDLPLEVCKKWVERGKVPAEVILKHDCVVIDGPGPVDGPIIFS